MLRFELTGMPGNYVWIDPNAVTSVCEGVWPTPNPNKLFKEKPVATLYMMGSGEANDGGNWTVNDPDRNVAKQIEQAKQATVNKEKAK